MNQERFLVRYYKPPTFTSRDPLFEKYFWMSPYAYCANNPVKYIDPTGMSDDWYEDENGKMIYTTEYTSYEAFKKSGINGTYRGKTYQKDGIYYSLFGQTIDANSKNGEITKKIDEAFIEKARYNKETMSPPDNPFNAEFPEQYSTDFTCKHTPYIEKGGILNVHLPKEMGTYAGIADIYFYTSKDNMKGKFLDWKTSSNISGRNGNYATPLGVYLSINKSGTNNYVLMGLNFKSQENLNLFKTKFYELFPITK